MTGAVMLIAPGTQMDRAWWVPQAPAVRFIDAAPKIGAFLDWSPEPRMATRRRVMLRGWKIILSFYVDDRLSAIPDGYVLPGAIMGATLEQCPIGEKP